LGDDTILKGSPWLWMRSATAIVSLLSFEGFDAKLFSIVD